MRDYKTKSCPERGKGTKCYKCSKFGQIANCRPSAVRDNTHETREREKRETKIHTKLSRSEYANPVVIVANKAVSHRVRIRYRELIKRTKRD